MSIDVTYTEVSGLKRGTIPSIENFWHKIAPNQEYSLQFKCKGRQMKSSFTLRRIGKVYPDPQLFELTINAPTIMIHRCCLVVFEGRVKVYAWAEDVFGYPSCMGSLPCWNHEYAGTSLRDEDFFCLQGRFRGCLWNTPFLDRGSEVALSTLDAIYYGCATLMHKFALEEMPVKSAPHSSSSVPSRKGTTPVEHVRREHIRHMKNGKTVIVHSSVVNKGKKKG